MRVAGAEPNSQLATPTTRDAATVILISDRDDLHVLMLERTGRAVFGPGATVFPGGAVDPEDLGSCFADRVIGLGDAAASAEQGISRGGLGFRVAAVRECLEEAGIMLARDASTGQPVAHDAELDSARVELNAGALAFGDFLVARDLVIDARELRVFSHWLTPLGAPRRYNTWFFVAPAPEGEDGTHDDNELVASQWVRPTDALAQYAAGEIDLIFPTEMSLRVLAHYERVQDLLADLDAVPRGVNGTPAVVTEGTGERVALPHDALPHDALPHDALPHDDGRPTTTWTIPLPDLSFRLEQSAAREVSQ